MKRLHLFVATLLLIPGIIVSAPKKDPKKSKNDDLDLFLKEFNKQNEQEKKKLDEEKARLEQIKAEKAQQQALIEAQFKQEFPDYHELGIAKKRDRDHYKQELSRNVAIINIATKYLMSSFYYWEGFAAEKYFEQEVQKYPTIISWDKNNQITFASNIQPEDLELAAYIAALNAARWNKLSVLTTITGYITTKMPYLSPNDTLLAQASIAGISYVLAKQKSTEYGQNYAREYLHLINSIKKSVPKKISSFLAKATSHALEPELSCNSSQFTIKALQDVQKVCIEYAKYLEKLYITAQKLGIKELKAFKISPNFRLPYIEYTTIQCAYPQNLELSTVQQDTTQQTKETITTTDAEAIEETEFSEELTKNESPKMVFDQKLPYKKMHPRVAQWFVNDPEKVFEQEEQHYRILNPDIVHNPWFKIACIIDHTFTQLCDFIALRYGKAHLVESFQQQGSKKRSAYWVLMVPAYFIFDDGYKAGMFLTYCIDQDGVLFHRCAQKNTCYDHHIKEMLTQRLEEQKEAIEKALESSTTQVITPQPCLTLDSQDTIEINNCIIKISDTKNKLTIIIPRIYDEEEVQSTDFYKLYSKHP